MCRMGREKSKPNCPSIDTRWLRPIPRTNRPPVAAWAVSACWAITTGWRVNVGTTKVPSSRRFVRAPPSARAIAASKPREETFGIQTAWRPSASARSIAVRSVPRSGFSPGVGTVSPMRMGSPPRG